MDIRQASLDSIRMGQYGAALMNSSSSQLAGHFAKVPCVSMKSLVSSVHRADARDFQQLDSLGCCVAPLLYHPNYDPSAPHLEAASISSCTCLIREARLTVGSRIRKVSIIRVRG